MPQGEVDERFETPSDAALVRVPIKAGDVVVLATDGLFDNMPESEVLQIFEQNRGCNGGALYLMYTSGSTGTPQSRTSCPG